MRIVGKEEFLALPEGTVYSSYESFGIISGLNLKGVTSGSDFYLTRLIDNIESEDTEEWLEVISHAEKDPKFHFPIDPFCGSRDGLFDDDSKFAVWDKEDIEKFLSSLLQCAIAYGGLNISFSIPTQEDDR